MNKNIFQINGVPVKFKICLPTGSMKRDLTFKIKQFGGEIAERYDDKILLLCPEDYILITDNSLIYTYIHKCIDEKKLLDNRPFKLSNINKKMDKEPNNLNKITETFKITPTKDILNETFDEKFKKEIDELLKNRPEANGLPTNFNNELDYSLNNLEKTINNKIYKRNNEILCESNENDELSTITTKNISNNILYYNNSTQSINHISISDEKIKEEINKILKNRPEGNGLPLSFNYKINHSINNSGKSTKNNKTYKINDNDNYQVEKNSNCVEIPSDENDEIQEIRNNKKYKMQKTNSNSKTSYASPLSSTSPSYSSSSSSSSSSNFPSKQWKRIKINRSSSNSNNNNNNNNTKETKINFVPARMPIIKERRRGVPFTYQEDLKILQYIIDNNYFHQVKGKKMWRLLVKENTFKNRHPDTLECRFRKQILKNISNYAIDKKYINLLKDVQVCQPSHDRKEEFIKEINSKEIKLRCRPYSSEEDYKIIKKVCQDGNYKCAFSRSFWKNLEQQKFLKDRTFHSMETHFRKSILQNLDKYILTEKQKLILYKLK